jgi:hypothetical protein
LFVTGAIGLIHLRVSSDSSCRMFSRPVLYSCTSCYRDPMVRLCTPILLVQSRVSLPFLTALPVHHTLVITFALPVICFAFTCCILLFVVDFLCQPRSFPHSTTSCRACSQPSCAFLTNATAIPMLIALTLPAIRANLPPFSRRCFLLSPIAFHHQHFLIPISAAPELILSPQRCPSLQQLCVTSQ